MFSNEIDKSRGDRGARMLATVLGTAVLIAVVAALVSARTTPGGWVLVCAAVVVSAWPGRAFSGLVDVKTPLSLSLFAFFAFAALSSLWAENPLAPLRAGLFGLVTVFVTRFAISRIGDLSRPTTIYMAEGLWLGFLIALLYFAVELSTGQAVKLSIYNGLGLGPSDLKPTAYFKWNDDGTLRKISLNDMTRNTTPITLFMWSAMLAARGALSPPWGKWIAGVLFGLSVICVSMSPHETSKLALIFGLVVFGLAYLSRRWSAIGMMGLWAGACALMLPLVLVAHDMKMQDEGSFLQNSARARVIIWNETASRTLQAPVLGVGARMTYELGPRLLAERPKNEGEWFPAKLSRHAHNAFLQTWFELGGVGALLLLVCGVLVVGGITRLAREVQPYGLATFASAAVVAGSSYGMWQAWFIGLYALAPVLFMLAHAVNGGGAAKDRS